MSQTGDVMICSIWSGGYMRGIYIGPTKRRNHFSEKNNEIIIEIDGNPCKAKLTPSFWNQCPEIRVARRSPSGINTLHHWIRNNNLLPPAQSKQEKGKKDTVKLEVIVPYKKFRLSLNP